jgi:hypothetical protein
LAAVPRRGEASYFVGALRSYVLEVRRGAMVRDDGAQRRKPEDIMAVLTRRGAVVWSRGPRRVALFKALRH